MRKINNPFVKYQGYNCFGCSPSNPLGLKMSFVEEDGYVVSTWEPNENLQGYFKVLHGGIQATLMDEIASWVVYTQLKTAGFTSRAEIRYLKTVFVDKGPLTLKARALGMRRNLADIEVKLYNHEKMICAEGMFTYFTFPSDKAKDSLYYPGDEEFFESETQS